jgi:hypothetical protein
VLKAYDAIEYEEESEDGSRKARNGRIKEDKSSRWPVRLK